MNEDPIIIGGEFERSLGRRLVSRFPTPELRVGTV